MNLRFAEACIVFPEIAKPKMGNHMNRCRFRSSVIDRNFHQNIIDIRFRIFNVTIEIAVVLEYIRIQQFKFRTQAALSVFAATIRDREMIPADICKETYNRNEWERNRDENKVLSHLLHDCLRHWSIQKAFL